MYYLGTINCASGVQANNWTGASGTAPFAIPVSTKAVFLEPNLAGVQFSFGAATGISFLAGPTQMAFMPDANVAAGPFYTIPGTITVAIYSASDACRVKVFAAVTP